MAAVGTMEAGTERVSLDWARSLGRARRPGAAARGADRAVRRPDRDGLVVRRRKRRPARHGRQRRSAHAGVFLETGKLFPETLAYQGRAGALGWGSRTCARSARSGRPRAIRPGRAAVAAASPTCAATSARPSRWIRRLAGFAGWITGRKRFQGGVRDGVARRSRSTPSPARSSSTRWSTGPRTISGTIAGCASCRCTLCWRAASRRSAARHAHGRSRRGGCAGRSVVAARQDRVRHPPRRGYLGCRKQAAPRPRDAALQRDRPWATARGRSAVHRVLAGPCRT